MVVLGTEEGVVQAGGGLAAVGGWTLALVAAGLALLLVLQQRGARGGRLPPGPWGLPGLGAVPFWRGPETNLEWAQRYGPVYCYRAGPVLVVYLDRIELVKTYLEQQGELFLDRPPGPAAIANGVLFGSGEAWSLNRRLISQAIWQGPNMAARLEAVVLPLLETLLDRLKMSTLTAGPVHGPQDMARAVTMTGQPQGALVGDLFLPFVTNLLASLIRGRSYHQDDTELAKLSHLLEEVGQVDLTSMRTLLTLRAPRLRRLLSPGSPDLHQLSAHIQSIVRGWVDQHQEARRQGQGRTESCDCIDEFLDSAEYSQMNSDDKEQIQSLMDVFFGGVSSLLSGVEFLFLYLLHHPQVASRLQAEVAGVTGGGQPSWGHREQLPYCRAVLLEVQRLASITPSCLPHVARQECQVEGYRLPAGTHLKCSHFVLHRDPQHFPDPEAFKPERHLDAQGKVKIPDSFRPYGVGPRLCPGELLTEITLFLTLTNVMQKYDVTPVGSSPPPFQASMRVVRRLTPYRAVFRPRT